MLNYIKSGFLFIYRFQLNLCSLILIQLPLQIIGLIVLLPVSYFYQIGSLPRVFRWFDSADPFTSRDTSVISSVNSQGYIARYLWLAYRNPINYFQYKVLGYQFSNNEVYNIVTGQNSMNVGNTSGNIPGFKYIYTQSGIYEYLYILRYNSTTCFYFRMGYKIGDMSNKPGSWCESVFTISPFKSYTGN